MANGENVKITVTDVPKSILDRVQQEAIENGISPNSYPAAVRWALAQFVRVLDRDHLHSGSRT